MSIRNVSDRERALAATVDRLHPSMQSEIDELRAENARISALADKWNYECDDLREDNKRLDAEIAAILQAMADPENQPSQFGTVTVAMYEAIESELIKLKAQEPVAHFDLAINVKVGAIAYDFETHKLQSGTPLYLAAGAQGHTREQPAPDRRKGLDAHHVYCRVITGDSE